MIGKSIPNTRKSCSKRSRCSGLMTYMENPQDANKEEKCIYSNHRGFLNDDQKSRIAEMIALSEESRSADPIEHIVFSWQEDEIPTDGNIERLIDVLLEQTKMKDHQIVYSLHKDTDNVHLHVMINRVNPVTCRAKHMEWKLNEILKVVALIEHEQNWKTETNAVYRILDGKLKDMRSPSSPDRKKTVNGKLRDNEIRTGEKSALRQAQEQAIPILKSTKDWQNLHERLAKIGMKYEKKGSGALIFVGDVPVKASDVGSPYTLSKMQKRLGEYQPPSTSLKIAPSLEKEPINDIAKDLGWHDYKIARESNKAGRKIKKEALDSNIRSERQDLFLRQQKDRQEIFRNRPWSAGRDLLNAMRSTVALKHAQEKAEMIDRQKILRKTFQTENPSLFPSFENWLRVTNGKESSELYRKALVAEVHGPGSVAEAISDIRNYDPVVIRKEVQYKNKSNRQTDFVDVGPKIKFLNRSDEAVLAGLQLCQQRFGKNLTLYGSEYFKKQAIKIAVANRITIANPELQEEIFKLEGQRLRRERLIDPFSKLNETDETKKQRRTVNGPGF